MYMYVQKRKNLGVRNVHLKCISPTLLLSFFVCANTFFLKKGDY